MSSRHSSRHATPELSQFELDIINDHSAAEQDASNFEVKWDTIDMRCNCIAYAVGATDQWMNPFTIAELTQNYNERRYFEISASSPLQRGDVEVYLNGSEPKHAHKIVGTSHGGTARSKMGNGPVIEHPRRMLDSSMRSRPGQYRYGRIAMRFRRDDRKYETWYEENFTMTTTGRVIKRSRATKSASGRRIVEKGKDTGHKTRSGRVWKNTSSSGGAADQYYAGYYESTSSSSSRRGRDYDHDYEYDYDYGRSGYDRGGYYESSRGLGGPDGAEKPQGANLDLGALKKKHKKLGWCLGCFGVLFGRRQRRQQQKGLREQQQWQQQHQQQHQQNQQQQQQQQQEPQQPQHQQQQPQQH